MVLLDDAGTRSWRVSSPDKRLANLLKIWPGGRAVLIRKQDWAGLDQQLINGARLTLSSKGLPDMEQLNLFPCALNSPMRLGVKEAIEDAERALLSKDGQISQQISVPVRCSLFGATHSCKKWNLENSMKWRAECKNISDKNVELVTEENQKMTQLNVILSSNITKSMCCSNPDNFVSVFATQAFSNISARLLNEALAHCHFSHYISGRCVFESGQLEKYRLCFLENYVIRQYSKVNCYSNEVVKNVCDVQYLCKS